MKTLSKVAKKLFTTSTQLKKQINRGDFGEINLILDNKNARSYYYLTEADEKKIYKKYLEKALLLKDKYEQAGWKFDYEEINQIENGFKKYVEKGFMPKLTYSSYIFAKSNLDVPIDIIQDEEPLIDNLNDLWIYVAYSIRKNRIKIDAKVDDFGKIIG